ncbi:DUF445 domain-containing protein [Pullulanibacillus sp. KACC 23026]|uniref:DUF445 domain-containing protein n=1 Tax=Pullulanibacillus sp. KACC 23026 TaxID=3028315 RepID=UPI0023B0006A|nr:DUF445 domain-containing protein [Pullulanibacillus sp. KACC 23026]WEG13506.1 DUF445 domain-containing protein [Pullulanibacillus sp. KACC 23026]
MSKSNSKFLAMTSLILMAIGFIVTLFFHQNFLLKLLHGGFEAGLVGGLADWFAVTALFRHPLGLPIPHTALLPNNREKMTKGIISMVEDNWLSKSSIIEKIGKRISAEQLISLLEKEISSEKAKETLASLLIELVKSSEITPIANGLEKELKNYFLSLNSKKLIDSLLPFLLEQKLEEKGFDLILNKASEWIQKEENRNKIGAASLKGLSGLKLDGFLQFALNSLVSMMSDEKMGQILSKLLINAAVDLQQKDNSLRNDLIATIRGEISQLGSNEKLIESLESWKNAWISQHDLSSEIGSVLTKLKQNLIHILGDSNKVDQTIYPYVMQGFEKLKSNPALMDKFDAWLEKSVIDFIDKNHEKIGAMVKENLDKLDDNTLTLLIEEKVGKDIQWIRVNGAVCGFVIGIILSLF